VFFTVTHPFHPLSEQRFMCLGRYQRWGEARVSFLDPHTGLLRSLPLAWTDWAPPDPYHTLGAGQALLRLTDVQALALLVRTLRTRQDVSKVPRAHGVSPEDTP
jgi:hypothetical protein